MTHDRLDPEELSAATDRIRGLLEQAMEDLRVYMDVLRRHLAAEKRTDDGIQRQA